MLHALAETIPSDFELLIIAESWPGGAEPLDLKALFGKRAEVGKFSPFKEWRFQWRWTRFIQLLFKGSYVFSANFGTNTSFHGDDLIWVRKL